LAEKHVAKLESLPQTNYRSAIIVGSIFIAIIVFFPLFMDFMVDLSIAVGVPRELFVNNPWLIDVLGYLPAFLLLLFYMKTTFEPLSAFGYRWNNQYLWWSVYIGIASGVIMFGLDWTSGLDTLGVSAFNGSVAIGYLLTWVLLPALLEETFFRGVIQTIYQRYTHTTFTNYRIHIAIFIAVVFELLFHLSFPIYDSLTAGNTTVVILRTIPQLIYVAVFGFISGVIYQRTNSLAGPMIIHALGNATELILIWAFH
jgi:membrane protease YdiL (CAAX protease family)